MPLGETESRVRRGKVTARLGANSWAVIERSSCEPCVGEWTGS
jgi:hypothetical protein